MAKKRFQLLFFTSLVLLACGLTDPFALPIRLPSGGSDPESGVNPAVPRVVLPADPNATATPFLPADPTARALTPTPVPTAAWGGFPGPSVPPSVPIPPPVEPLSQPDGQINVLLLGSDQRPDSGGFRTDTIILLTLNPDLGTASLTSFPRDLYVYIPGWTMQRINTAQPHGGFEMMQHTFEYNFGLRPDYYALVNFWSFVFVVDNLGGINVNAAIPLTDHRDGYGDYTIPAGFVHMDGATALWYVRARYSTSDFDRTRRQQEVLLALFFRIISLNGLQRAPELYDLYNDNVVTNATFADFAPLLGLAAHLADDTSGISTYSIGSTLVTPYRTVSGAAVLLPNYDAITAVLQQALHVP